MVLDSDALTAVNNNARLDMCARGYFYDYGGSSVFGTAIYQNIFYSSDETGTSKDPYISVTIPVAGKTLLKILSGKITLKGGKLTIK